MSQKGKNFLMLFLPVMVLAGGIFVSVSLASKVTLNEKRQIFVVKKLEDFRSLIKRLEKENLISSRFFYQYYARIIGVPKCLKAGEYIIPPRQSMKELSAILCSGVSISSYLTVPEGYNIYDIQKVLVKKNISGAKTFMSKVRDSNYISRNLGIELKSLEGYLYPDTYAYEKSTDVDSIIKKMFQQGQKIREQLSAHKRESAAANDWSWHKVLTLASIVEKETGASFEREIISSVFHNRLRKNMMLQTDPTVLYAKYQWSGKFSNNITRKDLRRSHPYNTYTVKGLPPGPISAPGRLAIIAALNPRKTNYLYFVSKNNGTHIFSENYKQHQAAVNDYQKNPKARSGKSWRDLKNNK